jgi:hypothetical protein
MEVTTARYILKGVEICAFSFMSFLLIFGAYNFVKVLLERSRIIRKTSIGEMDKYITKTKIILNGSDEYFGGENVLCAICLDYLVFPLINFDCGHCYHKKCGEQWIEVQKSCPLCRQHV